MACYTVVSNRKASVFSEEGKRTAREMILAGRTVTQIYRHLQLANAFTIYKWLRTEPDLEKISIENGKRRQREMAWAGRDNNDR